MYASGFFFIAASRKKDNGKFVLLFDQLPVKTNRRYFITDKELSMSLEEIDTCLPMPQNVQPLEGTE
jgi:hypothetical protein